MENTKKSIKETRIKRLIILSKELQHFISIETNQMCTEISVKQLIYSVEMKLIKRFNDVMICTTQKDIITITIYN